MFGGQAAVEHDHRIGGVIGAIDHRHRRDG
jgi:hypothetical protein